MDRAGTTLSHHDDLVILATRLNDELVVVTVLDVLNLLVVEVSIAGGSEELLTLDAALNVVLLKGITQHQAPLANIQFNGVASVSGGTEVSESGGGHVVV